VGVVVTNTPSPLVPTIVKRRGGMLDILLVALVLVTAWGRTPVANLVSRGVQTVLGIEHREPPLTSYFRIERSWDRLTHHLARHPVPPVPSTTPTEGFPEPYRSAARIVLEDAAIIERLDEAWTGDPEATLEVVAIGEELRDRAIRRADAAGRENPDRYRSHRAYLPQDAMVVADEAVDGVLAVGLLLDLEWPVDVSSPISSGWGDRIHPISGQRKFHNGVDLAVPVGTPVLAAQPGTVLTAAEDDRNGRYLVLEHGHGVRTAYCHLDELLVDKRSSFERGEMIARSGNSGRSTGPHLHFVVRVNGKTLDPLPLRRTPTQAALLRE